MAKLDHADVTTACEATAWAYIGPLVGVVVGGGFTWVIAALQRRKEHLSVRKMTYSACATALMTHYTALQSLKYEFHMPMQNASLAAERFNKMSSLNTVAIQSVAAVMVEGPSQTVRVAEEAARALERSSEKLRHWIVSGGGEPRSSDLDNSYGDVKRFMVEARISLRYPPRDEEIEVVTWQTRVDNWLKRPNRGLR
ncbi:hypothetical protein [Streptomyces sp. NPDC096013]|uniref:hypothetical protein n=1 Tax=Streptomyces sp. NPDC096013 TaxID=3366069 RepID=UPI00381F5DFF